MASFIDNTKAVLRAGRVGRKLSAALLAMGMALAASPALGQVAMLTSAPPIFNPAAVGIAHSSAQTITATFNVTGYAGNFTPTARLHYGLSYSLGAVHCTGGPAPESCSVPITFQPLYPGGRPDALQLMNGSTVLTTVPIYGIGQAPFALIQPGVITQPNLSPANAYYYNSIVGEDGTAYVLSQTSETITSVTAAGVVTPLPITGFIGAPYTIAIDGAGILYIAQNTYSKSLVTYDTSRGVQGSLNVEPPPPFVPCQNTNDGNLEYPFIVATGIAGEISVFENLCQQFLKFAPNGTLAAAISLNPPFSVPVDMIADSSGNLFLGGNAINELTPGGVQTQINTVGATSGIAVDAAGTLYATRYGDFGGVAELPAANYATLESQLDSAGAPAPLGVGLGPDGTVYVGNYTQVDKVDRSQGAIAFGVQPSVGVQSDPQSVQVYNGGNQPLTVSSFSISGDGFALQTAATSPCSSGLVLAAGALCNISATFTPSHPGNSTGTITIVTNSLNGTGVMQMVALSGVVNGIYVTASPNPLAFGFQAPGTTSAAQGVTLTNNGALYSASIGTITTSDPAFKVTGNNCPVELAPGASCMLQVTFSPAGPQAYAGTINFLESGGAGPDQQVDIDVNGTGMPPTIMLPIMESIHVTDFDTPVLAIFVPIMETIHVTDVDMPVPALFIPIAESIHVTDASASTLAYSTAVDIVASTSNSYLGGAVTLKATVRVPGNPVLLPAGTVNFYDGNTLLHSAGASLGMASFSTSSLSPGVHTLHAVYSGNPTFAPSTSANITVTVTIPTLTVTANNASRAVGAANPVFTANYSGFVNGDTSAILSGAPSLSTTATAASPAGNYPITVTKGTLSAANYTFAFVDGTLSVGTTTGMVVITATSALTAVTGGYQATITITNSGTAPASNVTLTTAALGPATGTPLPQNLGTLAAGASGIVTVTFPASAGSPGSAVVEKYNGTYTGGTFGAGFRAAILP